MLAMGGCRVWYATGNDVQGSGAATLPAVVEVIRMHVTGRSTLYARERRMLKPTRRSSIRLFHL